MLRANDSFSMPVSLDLGGEESGSLRDNRNHQLCVLSGTFLQKSGSVRSKVPKTPTEGSVRKQTRLQSSRCGKDETNIASSDLGVFILLDTNNNAMPTEPKIPAQNAPEPSLELNSLPSSCDEPRSNSSPLPRTPSMRLSRTNLGPPRLPLTRVSSIGEKSPGRRRYPASDDESISDDHKIPRFGQLRRENSGFDMSPLTPKQSAFDMTPMLNPPDDEDNEEDNSENIDCDEPPRTSAGFSSYLPDAMRSNSSLGSVSPALLVTSKNRRDGNVCTFSETFIVSDSEGESPSKAVTHASKHDQNRHRREERRQRRAAAETRLRQSKSRGRSLRVNTSQRRERKVDADNLAPSPSSTEQPTILRVRPESLLEEIVHIMNGEKELRDVPMLNDSFVSKESQQSSASQAYRSRRRSCYKSSNNKKDEDNNSRRSRHRRQQHPCDRHHSQTKSTLPDSSIRAVAEPSKRRESKSLSRRGARTVSDAIIMQSPSQSLSQPRIRDSHAQPRARSRPRSHSME